MKYLKLFEYKYHEYRNGDLVILAYNQPQYDWIYNIYGKIIVQSEPEQGIVYRGYIPHFKVDYRITDDEIEHRAIEREFDVHTDFISGPFSRKEYEEKVKEIELEKLANKYNL